MTRPSACDEPTRPPLLVQALVLVVVGPLVLALYAIAAAVTHARRLLARRPSPAAVALAIRIATARRNHR